MRRAPLRRAGRGSRYALPVLLERVRRLRDRLAGAWPHLRALLIAFHVLAVVALAFPQPHRLLDRRGWESANTRHDLARWAARLRALGLDMSDEGFARRLRALAEGYAGVHAALVAPFAPYARWTGTIQGWAMFSSAQKHPAELHVDILVNGAWQPVYRPHSDEHDFWGARFRHNRMRKQLGRFARTLHQASYNGLARHVAIAAARAFPDAREIRVRLYRYAALAPEAVRAGQAPAGRYDHVRRFNADTLRSVAP